MRGLLRKLRKILPQTPVLALRHHQHAVQAGEVRAHLHGGLREAVAGEGGGGGALGVADLQEQRAARVEVRGRLPQQLFDEAEAVGAAVEAQARLVFADLGRGRFELCAGDVGRCASGERAMHASIRSW